MRHFEENKYEGMDVLDALPLLGELAGSAGANAAVTAGNGGKPDETDAGLYWGIIAVCEGVLDGMDDKSVSKGLAIVRAGVAPRSRDKIDEAVENLMHALLGKDE